MVSPDQLSVAELVACLELGKALTSELEPQRLLQALLDKVSAMVPAQNWSLVILDEDTDKLRFAVTVGLDHELVKDLRLDLGQGIVGRVVQSLTPLLVEDVSRCDFFDPRVDEMAGFQTKSIMCAPLVFAGKPLGAIEVVNPHRLDETALTLLTITADFVAIAAENARRYRRMHELSIHDDLTALFNTRYMYQSLQKLIDEGQPFSLIFMDLDDFKQVVDTHGHLKGSQVLQEVAATIRQCLNEPAYGVSYGGDEFVVVLPAADRDQALLKSLEIKERMARTPYLAGQGLQVALQASFGVAAFPHDAQDLSGLLALADQAMFSIKRRGKNAVGVE